MPAKEIASLMAATYLGVARSTGDSDKISDKAAVVRGGIAAPEQLAGGTGPHRDVPGLAGYSAQVV